MIVRPVVPTLATAPTKNQLLGQFLAASSERRVRVMGASIELPPIFLDSDLSDRRQ